MITCIHINLFFQTPQYTCPSTTAAITSRAQKPTIAQGLRRTSEGKRESNAMIQKIRI